jgi:hypothetical protein
MKNPLELAEEHCINTAGFVSKQDCGNYLAGYDAAEARIVNLIKEELQLIQTNKRFNEIMQQQSVEVAIQNILEKIERQ